MFHHSFNDGRLAVKGRKVGVPSTNLLGMNLKILYVIVVASKMVVVAVLKLATIGNDRCKL